MQIDHVLLNMTNILDILHNIILQVDFPYYGKFILNFLIQNILFIHLNPRDSHF